MARIPNIEIEHAQLRFKNFSGRGDKFNPEGKRNFCVLIDPAQVDMLKSTGWNIKFLKPKEEGVDPIPYLKVNVSYANVPPNVFIVTNVNGNQKVTKVGEDAISSLDYADIENVDVVISPYYYNNPRIGEGLSAYLKTLYVTIIPDAFAAKYADPNTEGDIPF